MKMKKLLSLFIMLVLCVGCFAACGEDDSPSNETQKRPDYGSATVFVPGDVVQIVFDNNFDQEGAETIKSALDPILNTVGDGGAYVTTRYAENSDLEIIVGLYDETRPATVKARQLLEKLDKETYFLSRYVVYAENNCIAIAYDENEYTSLQSGAMVAKDFAKKYIEGKEYIALGKGIIASGEIDLISVQEELDAAYLEECWANLEKASSPELVAAMKTYYSMCGDGIVDWAANLYDPGVGGYYASSSGRDGAQFGPDVQNTVQMIRFIVNTGMVDNVAPTGNWREFLPELMQYKLVYWAKSLQDPNGYFYHPHWSRATVDAHLSRRGRDLGWATSILSELGSAPQYKAANGNAGDGISAEEYWESLGLDIDPPYTYDKCPTEDSIKSAFTTPLGSASAAVAVSKVVLTASEDASTAYLRDYTKFLDYMLDKIVPGMHTNPYSFGNEVGETYKQILTAGRELEAAQGKFTYTPDMPSRYEPYDGMNLVEITVAALNSCINPVTGLWGDLTASSTGTEFRYTNGFMKAMAAYEGFGVCYPTEYMVKAADALMEGLMGDEPSTGNICEVYNVWCSIVRLKSNVNRLSSTEPLLDDSGNPVIDEETGKPVLLKTYILGKIADIFAEKGPYAVENSYNKIVAYQKYDGGFAHNVSRGTTTHQDHPVSLDMNQSDVDATSIAVSGNVNQMFSALGLSRYEVPRYTESDWMRYLTILFEMGPVIKYSYDGKVVDPVYTFDTDPAGVFTVTGTNEIVTEKTSAGDNNVLKITKTSTDVGNSVAFGANTKDVNANVTVFEADVKYANLTNLSETQITLVNSSYDGLAYSPILILLTFEGKADGSKIFYSDYTNGAGNQQKLDTGAVVGSWFKIRVEYYEGTMSTFCYKTYINDKLIYTSKNVYSTKIHSGSYALPTADQINKVSYAMNMRFMGEFYFDNLSLTQTVVEDIPNIDGGGTGGGTTGGGSSDIPVPGDWVAGPVVTFDGMPPTTVLDVVSKDVSNIYSIVASESENKMIHIEKLSNESFASGVTFNQQTTVKGDVIEKAVFSADILLDNLTSVADVQLIGKATKGSGNNDSPFLILLTPEKTAEGSKLYYRDYNNGGATGTKLDSGAVVGEWFRLRLEYTASGNDGFGKPSEVEVKTYVNDVLIHTSTARYGKNLSVNGGDKSIPTVADLYCVSLSFNRMFLGDLYIDNLLLHKTAGDFVIPEVDSEYGKVTEPDPTPDPEPDPEPDPTPDPEPDPEPMPEVSKVLTFAEMPATNEMQVVNSYESSTSSIVTLDSGNKVLSIAKTHDGSFSCAYVLRAYPLIKEENAALATFTADVKLSSLTSLSQIQLTLASKSGTGSKQSPFMILLSPTSTADGSVIKYSDQSGSKNFETEAVVGEWFRVTIEYKVTETDAEGVPTAVEVKTYINGKLVDTSSYIYGADLAANGGTKAIPKISDISFLSFSVNSKLAGEVMVDNFGFALTESTFEMPEVDSEVNENGADEPVPEEPKSDVVTFDEADALSIIKVASPGITAEGIVGTNEWDVITVDGEKVLRVKKSATGHDASGTLLNYTCGVSATKSLAKLAENGNVVIFEADFKFVSIESLDHIQIIFNSNGTTPILGLLKAASVEEGSVINNESKGTAKSETSAKVGERFHIRVEYRVTASDASGNATAIEVKYFIGDDEAIVTTEAYNGNLMSLEAIKSCSLAVNRQFKGEFYIDNMSFRLEYEEPAAV